MTSQMLQRQVANTTHHVVENHNVAACFFASGLDFIEDCARSTKYVSIIIESQIQDN